MGQNLSEQSFRYARGLITADGLPAPYGKALIQAFVPAAEQGAFTELLPSLPRLQLAAGELLDMELIASGALSPLTGFMTCAMYESVLNTAVMPDGMPWGLPVTLAVSREAALSIRSGQEVALYRGDRVVGVMQVEDMYAWDPDRETRALGGGHDETRTHERRKRQAAYLVGGPIALLAARDAGFMQTAHHWPLELRSRFLRRAWQHVSVPHVHQPWRRTHEYLIKCALEASDALLLHMPADPRAETSSISSRLLVSASRMLIENYFPVDRVLENPVPTALLSPTARAVLTHAILSQNYGAGSLFIPSPAGEKGARELLEEAARYGLVIRPTFVPEAFHCEPCGGVATRKSCPHETSQHHEISDQEIGEQLRRGEALSPLVTRPDIARFLAREVATKLEVGDVTASGRHLHPHVSEVSRELRQSLVGHKSCALWMTGLSGSGKSTIAHRLERELLLAGHRVFVLDGDTLRHGLNRDLGFSEGDRRENLRRAAEVVKVVIEAGMIVIASFISPFRAERQMVREILGSAFHEIYVEANLETCEQRDPKGLYKRARAGQIPQFTGISSPYEAPENPDLRVDTTHYSVEGCVDRMREYLVAKDLLRSSAGNPLRAGRTAGTAPRPVRFQ